jgi:hypothetical protein
MRRDIVLRKICGLTKPADVLIFGGDTLASEAWDLYRPGYFYVDDKPSFTLPMSLGVTMGTDKRVFVFVSEDDVMRNLGILNQISFVKRQNIFITIFNGKTSEVFDKSLSMISLIFNTGCRVFDLTLDFNNGQLNVRPFFNRGQGPMVSLIRVDKSKKFDVTPENNLEEFMSFIRDTSIKTAMYNPFAEGFIMPVQEDAPILKV